MRGRELKKSEKVRAIRQIMTKFQIDLEKCTITLMGNTIYLSGRLEKFGRNDVTIEELMEIHRLLKQYSINLQTELTNWDMNGWQIKKLAEQLIVTTEAPKRNHEEEKDLIIDLSKKSA